jgi:hypothetical protein
VRDATLEVVECCSSTEKARVVLVHVKDAIATNGSRCLKGAAVVKTEPDWTVRLRGEGQM